MPPRAKITTASATDSVAASLNEAITPDAALAKAEAIRKTNAEALQTLSNHFGAERWARIIQRAQRSGMSADDISTLAGEMIATRKVHHPKNEQAALLGAANGFICEVGLSPTEADVKAFEAALAATAV